MAKRKIFNQLATIASLLMMAIFFGCGGNEAKPRPDGGGGGGGGDTNPVTSITSTPTNPTNLRSAQFDFICDKPSCTFECNLDNQGWASCASPVAYSGLAEGSHTFLVRAKDSDGRVDPNPPSYGWIILSASPNMDGIGYLAASSVIENRTQLFWGVPVSVTNANLALTITMTGASWADSESGDVREPGTGYNTTLTGNISGPNFIVSNGISKVPGKAPLSFTCSGGGQFLNGAIKLGVDGFNNNIWAPGMGGWIVTVDPVTQTIEIEPLPGGNAGNFTQVLFAPDSQANTPITQGSWNYERKIAMTSAKSEWDSGAATFAGASPNITFSFNFTSQDSGGGSGTGNGTISGWTLSADGHKLTKIGNDGYCLGNNNCAYDAFGYVSEKIIAIHEKMSPPGGSPVLYSTVILTR